MGCSGYLPQQCMLMVVLGGLLGAFLQPDGGWPGHAEKQSPILACQHPSCVCKTAMASIVCGSPQLTPLDCLIISHHRLQQPAQSLGRMHIMN